MWRGHRFSLHLEPAQSHSRSKGVRMDPGQGHGASSPSASSLRRARVTGLALDTGPVVGASALLGWGPRGTLSLAPGARRGAPRVFSGHPRAVVLAEGINRSFGDCPLPSSPSSRQLAKPKPCPGPPCPRPLAALTQGLQLVLWVQAAEKPSSLSPQPPEPGAPANTVSPWGRRPGSGLV